MSKTKLEFGHVEKLTRNGKLQTLFPDLKPDADVGTIAAHAMTLARRFGTVAALEARIETGTQYGQRTNEFADVETVYTYIDTTGDRWTERDRETVKQTIALWAKRGFRFTIGNAGINAHGDSGAVFRMLDTWAGTKHGPDSDSNPES